MRKFLTFLAVLGIAAAADAQTRSATFAARYDVASATATYCKAAGPSGDPFKEPFAGNGAITTAGSNTTVTSYVALSSALNSVAVGDTLIIPQPDGTLLYRNITAKASANSITVDEAIDLSAVPGFSYSFLRHTCGTGITAGWVTVNGPFAIALRYDAGDLGALKFSVQCRDASVDAQPVVLFPGVLDSCGLGTNDGAGNCEIAATGVTGALTVVEPNAIFAQCRVGLSWKTSDGGVRERVSVGYFERK